MEDLRNGSLSDVHASWLKFYWDSYFDELALLTDLISSETGMPLARIMLLTETTKGLQVKVRWKRIENSEDTFELSIQCTKTFRTLWSLCLTARTLLLTFSQKVMTSSASTRGECNQQFSIVWFLYRTTVDRYGRWTNQQSPYNRATKSGINKKCDTGSTIHDTGPVPRRTRRGFN